MAGLKTDDNQQFALVAEADGTRPVPLTPGEGIEPLADNEGRLYVNVHELPPPEPVAGMVYYDNGDSFALQAIANVTPDPANIVRVYGFKTGAGVEYVQLFDTGAGTPGLTVPFAQFPVFQNGTFSLDFGGGRPLANGLVVALSTTVGLFTAAAASMWVNAELTPA